MSGLYSLTNIPAEDEKNIEIRAIVVGDVIRIVRSVKGAAENDYLLMADVTIADHMLTKPEELRKMYAKDLISAITKARDVGYRQAQADFRQAIGLPRHRV